MGTDKRERQTKPSRTKSLFTTSTDDNGNQESFDWGGVDCARLVEIIQLVTGRGGAIRFGYSRDGHAGSVGVYYGEQRDTLYIRPAGDVEETFGKIEDVFRKFPFTGGKSPDQND